MLRRPEPGRAQNVEAARLEVVGLSILPAWTHVDVVVDRLSGAAEALLPEETVRLDPREDAVAPARTHELHGGGERVDVDERRGRLQKHEDPDIDRARLELIESVQQGALAAGLVPSQGGRALDDFGAPLCSDGGDVGVVGGDHDAVDGRAATRRIDGAGDERHAADALQVLARNALRAPAGRDDGDDLAHGAAVPAERRAWPVNTHAPVPASTRGRVVVVVDGRVCTSIG